MSRRTLVWLAVALVVLLGLALVGQRQTAPTTASSDAETRFLPGLMDALDEVDTVSIVAAGGAPVATLDRGPDGWTVRERDGYPADLTKVRHTLLSLAEATIVEAKTANPAFHSMLGVEDIESEDASGVAVTLEGPTPPVTVIVGDTAGDYRRYVRRAGEDRSYLINRDPEVGETAADWLDTTVIDLPAERVREITVTHPDGEVVRISKASAEQANFTVENIPEGRSLLYDSVANVMASVFQNLTLEDVERVSDEATAADETVVDLVTFDGLGLTVRGQDREDGGWIRISAEPAAPRPTESEDAAAQDDGEAADPAAEAETLNARLGGWRYRIPSYKYDQLTRRMDDLLQAQESGDAAP